MLKKFLKIFLITLAVLVVVGIGVFAYYYNKISKIANSQTICSGVTIDGIDVGGLSKQEAYDKVLEEVNSLNSKKITLTYEDHNDSVSLSELGLEVSGVDSAVEEAYALGKDGTTWERYQAISNGAGDGKNFNTTKSIAVESFEEYVDANAETLVKVAKDATLTRENGQFIISGGQKGMKIPVEENVEKINDRLNNDWDGKDLEVELTAIEADPEYSEEVLSKVKDVLGTYTTDYSTSSANRRANIANAASKIDGHVVFPGEELGLLELMVPFTIDNGYEVAQAYSAGEVVDSIGGGVCQVATTLYNAVLLSELEVVERHNHAMVVSYVPLSQDAAISEAGHQDFKFRNSSEYPVYVEAICQGTSLTFTIYGVEERPSTRKIEYISENVQTIPVGKDIITKDPNLAEGKQMITQGAHTGYRAKLWKVVYENGEQISKEEVNTSYYAPSARRVTVGTKKDEEETTEDSSTKKKDDSDNNKKKTVTTTEAPAVATTEAKKVVTTEAPVEVTEAPAVEETE
ncbi:MAG: VanW family protein [Lachnospiraceae bacterium]|nr:VanW family protein [Lachnospiraceae bacterium]